MTTAREALNNRVRELIERRLNGDLIPPREEAAEYVRQIQARGITSAQIAARVGTSRHTVVGWGRGIRSPATEVQFGRLAMMARNALALSVIERRTPTGMALVLETLRCARRCSMRQLGYDLGLSLRGRGGAVSNWIRGATRPSEASTLRIRSLALATGLPRELIAICDEYLKELAATRDRNRPWK